jgi:hypothetical protein
LAARRAHNPKVTGSSPVPAIVMIVGALATLRAWYTWAQAQNITYNFIIMVTWCRGQYFGLYISLKLYMAR